MSTFGSRLKAARLDRGLRQEDLAEALGVTKSAISAYEGGSATPTFDRLPALRAALSTSLDELICGDQTLSRMARQYKDIADGRSTYAAFTESVTRDELRLLRRYRALSDKRQRGLLVLLSD